MPSTPLITSGSSQREQWYFDWKALAIYLPHDNLPFSVGIKDRFIIFASGQGTGTCSFGPVPVRVMKSSVESNKPPY